MKSNDRTGVTGVLVDDSSPEDIPADADSIETCGECPHYKDGQSYNRHADAWEHTGHGNCGRWRKPVAASDEACIEMKSGNSNL